MKKTIFKNIFYKPCSSPLKSFRAFMKILILILSPFCTAHLYAQNLNDGVKLFQYVFNEFTPGTVKLKSGETSSQLLNYNILTNEMIFNDNGKYLAIANPENVDTVYIGTREFVPLNNKFYEVLVNAKMPLLLEFTASISEPGTSTGIAGNTTTSAATSYKSLVNSGGAYELKLPDNFKVKQGYAYWIMKDGEMEKIPNAKQLIKIFPDKKDIINDAIKKKDLKLSKREDVIMLVKLIEY
ncbi:MAG: hypothetical protein M3015_01895 [Bacteroidota bacterium]|nr:hypothetical protein [Bacteroidota bacterium]